MDLNLIIMILWFTVAILDYSDFVYIWQLKDYRIDRFKDFLSTKGGKTYWVTPAHILRPLAMLVLLFWPINSLVYFKYILLSLLVVDVGFAGCRIIQKKFHRPVITKKAMLIIVTGLLLETLSIHFVANWVFFIVLLFLRFLLISIIVVGINEFSKLVKRYYIIKAQKKISRIGMIVIGVTGSYGKTSVKEFLSHFLSAKYRVIKTPKNTNTEIGIAKYILKTDFSNAEIFVVEMGAYRPGEIKVVCKMVKPKIGILTSISEQHLALFGTLKNTQQAKYELLRSLPKGGLAVVNSDNKLCREFLNELKCDVYTFGVEEKYKPTCQVLDAKQSIDGTSCKFLAVNNKYELSTKLLGHHVCLNLAPCLLISNYLSISKEVIEQQASTVEPPEKTLRKYKFGKSIIIDDSYNANPVGFTAALNLFPLFPSEFKRIVITRGMLELGDKSVELHEKIGGEIAYHADELVVISKDSYEYLKKGVGDKYKTKIRLILETKDLLDYIMALKNTQAAVLIENRIPESVYNKITAK